MSKEVIIYNELHKILNRKYMYLSCYKEEIAYEMIKNDMLKLKKLLKEWLDE